MIHKFNNYTFVYGSKDHLASGVANYSTFDNLDEYEVSFDSVALVEVLSPTGWVKKEHLKDYEESVLIAFNRDENLLRKLSI